MSDPVFLDLGSAPPDADGPVPRLLEQLAARPGLAHFELERSGARIAMSRHAPAKQST